MRRKLRSVRTLKKNYRGIFNSLTRNGKQFARTWKKSEKSIFSLSPAACREFFREQKFLSILEETTIIPLRSVPPFQRDSLLRKQCRMIWMSWKVFFGKETGETQDQSANCTRQDWHRGLKNSSPLRKNSIRSSVAKYSFWKR